MRKTPPYERVYKMASRLRSTCISDRCAEHNVAVTHAEAFMPRGSCRTNCFGG